MKGMSCNVFILSRLGTDASGTVKLRRRSKEASLKIFWIFQITMCIPICTGHFHNCDNWKNVNQCSRAKVQLNVLRWNTHQSTGTLLSNNTSRAHLCRLMPFSVQDPTVLEPAELQS